jgi:F-type H+-transporting ATPase subunit delta
MKDYSSYAEALRSLLDDKELSAYAEALRHIEEDFEREPEFLEALSSYAAPKESQLALIDKVYGGVGLKHLCPFLKTLVDKRVIRHFKEISAAFLDLSNAANGIEEGIAYSAAPLSKEEIASLEKAMGKRLGVKVSLRNRVEPSLIGGVRVYVMGKAFDGSVEGRIEAMRSELLKKAGGAVNGNQSQ